MELSSIANQVAERHIVAVAATSGDFNTLVFPVQGGHRPKGARDMDASPPHPYSDELVAVCPPMLLPVPPF